VKSSAKLNSRVTHVVLALLATTLLMLLLAATARPAGALAASGSIAGKVTDASTKAPVAGISACLYTVAGFFEFCQTTDSGGEYTFTGVEVGEYKVGFFVSSESSLNYLNQFYNGKDLCEGSLVRVTRDRVEVTDLVHHRRIAVRAGRKYLAKAP
jgi:hypothetical protein